MLLTILAVDVASGSWAASFGVKGLSCALTYVADVDVAPVAHFEDDGTMAGQAGAVRMGAIGSGIVQASSPGGPLTNAARASSILLNLLKAAPGKPSTMVCARPLLDMRVEQQQ